LKIKARLFLTVGFVAAILATCSAVALWRIGAIGGGVQELVQGDTRAAAEMGQFGIEVAQLAGHERAYFLNASRSRPAGEDLQRWKGVYAGAMARLGGVESASPAAQPGIAAIRGALTGYEREFAALRQRVEREGAASVDPTGADARALRDAYDRLDRATSDELARGRAQIAARGGAVESDVSRG